MDFGYFFGFRQFLCQTRGEGSFLWPIHLFASELRRVYTLSFPHFEALQGPLRAGKFLLGGENTRDESCSSFIQDQPWVLNSILAVCGAFFFWQSSFWIYPNVHHEDLSKIMLTYVRATPLIGGLDWWELDLDLNPWCWLGDGRPSRSKPPIRGMLVFEGHYTQLPESAMMSEG